MFAAAITQHQRTFLTLATEGKDSCDLADIVGGEAHRTMYPFCVFPESNICDDAKIYTSTLLKERWSSIDGGEVL